MFFRGYNQFWSQVSASINRNETKFPALYIGTRTKKIKPVEGGINKQKLIGN